MDSHVFHALLLSSVAASGTTIGGLVILVFPNLQFKQLGYLAGLAAGLMLSMVFFELIPESMETLSFNATNAYFFLGVLLFATIVALVPEQQFESLVSSSSSSASPAAAAVAKAKGGKRREVRQVLLSGLITAVGITLHNFPEGLAIFLASKQSTKLGLTLTAAMTLHNIPEGIAVALPIYFATKSKWEALKITMLSGLAEPLAVVFAALFFPAAVSQHAVDAMLAGVAGIMAFLTFHELLPLAARHCPGGFSGAVPCLFFGMAAMSAMLALADGLTPQATPAIKNPLFSLLS
mmetsp:Transcript_20733/g.43816  ORF Transcript_20733/g.43816 Transcript_20733/m.43816 type:complete len:293 (-) Transcript_20733:82-960(-)